MQKDTRTGARVVTPGPVPWLVKWHAPPSCGGGCMIRKWQQEHAVWTLPVCSAAEAKAIKEDARQAFESRGPTHRD
eukprot:326967-Prymnesium_polylepis.1